jgi:hypothetical protein
LLPRDLQLPSNAPVEHLVPDARNHAADHPGIDQHLELDVLAGRSRQRLCQPGALVLVQRDGSPHLGHRLPATFGRHLCQGRHDALEISSPPQVDQERQQVQGVRTGPSPNKLL